MQGELSEAEAKKMLADFAELGTVLMAFSGGEPLLRKNCLGLAKHVRDLGMELSFLTNGLLVDERVAREIARLEPAAVSVSIDGVGKAHDYFRGISGSFDRARSALELLDAAGAPHCMISSITQSNFGELEAIKQLALDLDVWTWQVQVGLPTALGRLDRNEVLSPQQTVEVIDFIGRAREECAGRIEVIPADCIGYYLTPSERSVSWKGCNAGLCVMSVTSRGDVKGCLSMPDSCIEGNIRQQSLAEIWNGTNSFAYNRGLRGEEMTGACAKCEHLANCRGGCKAAAMALTGGVSENPLCRHALIKSLSA